MRRSRLATWVSLLLGIFALFAVDHVWQSSLTNGPSSIFAAALSNEEFPQGERQLDPSSLEAQIAEKTASAGRKKRGGANDGKKRKRKAKKNKKQSAEKQALAHWADFLTERDYNYTEWRKMYHSNAASDFFNGYGRKISNIFKKYEAKVNFAMVGACDGTGDNTIKYLYLPNSHWRGVFVEPMSINIRDLIKYMAEQNAAHRSLIIRAAATSECHNATITVERPLYEEKNKTIPHWLRRQIGSIVPQHRNHARREWTLETVRCITAKEILRDWAAVSAGSALASSTAATDPTAAVSTTALLATVDVKSPQELVKKTKLRRPHILKIDVEGHDFDVLMSFLRHDTPVNELPLIIDFEAKSIAKKYPLAKERMEYLYVSPSVCVCSRPFVRVLIGGGVVLLQRLRRVALRQRRFRVVACGPHQRRAHPRGAILPRRRRARYLNT